MVACQLVVSLELEALVEQVLHLVVVLAVDPPLRKLTECFSLVFVLVLSFADQVMFNKRPLGVATSFVAGSTV
uniref:Uncharacterized protein n=1 Tax=Ixodes ricinus TaxID=34613 RepID=A0A6B0U3L8_IXORI